MIDKKWCSSLLLFGSLIVLGGFSPAPQPTIFQVVNSSTNFADPLQEKALLILQSKCNECHGRKKKKAVFTIDNMNGFAKKINKQVFIKKRMPKGDEVKLTEKERTALKEWVELQLSTRS